MNGFTDIHHHLVFGVDDGPGTFRETSEMLRAARRNGIQTIVTTPHVTPGIKDFDQDAYFEKLEMMKAYCAHKQLDIQLHSGAEVFYTDLTGRFLKERRIPSLANTEYVLVEFSPKVRYDELDEAATSLLRSGYIPVFAHVERYQCLAKHPQRAIELRKKNDLRYQVNCSTILGEKGFFADRFCEKLLREGCIDAVATDAHNTGSRAVHMKAAYRLLEEEYGELYAQRLTGVSNGLLSLR